MTCCVLYLGTYHRLILCSTPRSANLCSNHQTPKRLYSLKFPCSRWQVRAVFQDPALHRLLHNSILSSNSGITAGSYIPCIPCWQRVQAVANVPPPLEFNKTILKKISQFGQVFSSNHRAQQHEEALAVFHMGCLSQYLGKRVQLFCRLGTALCSCASRLAQHAKHPSRTGPVHEFHNLIYS